MRRSTTFLVGGAVAVALALGALVGGVFAESPSARPSTAAPRALADQALAGAAGGIDVHRFAGLEAQVRSRPHDADLLTQLGFAYQLRWRETADPSYLPRSEAALRRALRARRRTPTRCSGSARSHSSDTIPEALAYGREARMLLAGVGAGPSASSATRLLELGRYDAAFAAFQRMVTLRPSLSSYARVAYARELTRRSRRRAGGHAPCARRGGGSAGGDALTLVELAKLELGLGRNRAANGVTRSAPRRLPGYPAAQLEIAQIQPRREVRARSGRGTSSQPKQFRPSKRSRSTPTFSSGPVVAQRPDVSGRRVAIIDRLFRRTACRSISRSAVYRADSGLASSADRRARPKSARRLVRRSTATTRWAGRSHAPAAAARLCRYA